MHPAFAAVRLPNEQAPLATLGEFDPAKVRLTVRLPSGGALLLGPRSDGNRSNAEEMQCAHMIAGPLSAALDVSMVRHGREIAMQRTIEQMQRRLAELEGGPAQPKPA